MAHYQLNTIPTLLPDVMSSGGIASSVRITSARIIALPAAATLPRRRRRSDLPASYT